MCSNMGEETIGTTPKEGIPKLSLVGKVSEVVTIVGEERTDYSLVGATSPRPVACLLRVSLKSTGDEVENYSLPTFEVGP